jgi:hypothetical protein
MHKLKINFHGEVGPLKFECSKYELDACWTRVDKWNSIRRSLLRSILLLLYLKVYTIIRQEYHRGAKMVDIQILL